MIKGAHLLAVLRGGAPLFMRRIYAIDICRVSDFVSY